jgi:hypothetical protein
VRLPWLGFVVGLMNAPFVASMLKILSTNIRFASKMAKGFTKLNSAGQHGISSGQKFFFFLWFLFENALLCLIANIQIGRDAAVLGECTPAGPITIPPS